MRAALLTATVSSIVFFAGLEAVCRLAFDPARHLVHAQTLYQEDGQTGALIFPRFFALDRELLWKFKPGLSVKFTEERTGKDFLFITDADGLRDEGPALGPATGTPYSILSLGESCTAGIEVEANYTKLLARKIAAADPSLRLRVQSAGTSGYTSEQGLRQMRRLLTAGAAPDLTLIHFGHNDAALALGGLRERELDIFSVYGFRIRRTLTRSYFISWLNSHVSPWWLSSRSPPHPGPRLTPEEYGENMNRIVEELKAKNARIVLINSVKPVATAAYSPPAKVISDARALEPYNRVLTELAEKYGATLIDLRELIELHGNDGFFNDPLVDTIHPGPLGHQAIADEIYAKLFGGR